MKQAEWEMYIYKNHSSSHTSLTYHLPKQQMYPERCLLDPPQTVTHQSEVSHPENIEVVFQKVNLTKKLKVILPTKKKLLYNRNITETVQI